MQYIYPTYESSQSTFLQTQVNSVRLPRHVANKKHFCGTALVEFSEDLASKLFKETLFYAGSELQIKPKYFCSYLIIYLKCVNN